MLGKPYTTKLQDYPDWDESDKKGSFMKINDMLIKEVLTQNNLDYVSTYISRCFLKVLEELPPLYELPEREVKWVERMLHYNVTGGKMNRGLMVVESVQELAKVSFCKAISTKDFVIFFLFSTWAKTFHQKKYQDLQFWVGQ